MGKTRAREAKRKQNLRSENAATPSHSVSHPGARRAALKLLASAYAASSSSMALSALEQMSRLGPISTMEANKAMSAAGRGGDVATVRRMFDAMRGVGEGTAIPSLRNVKASTVTYGAAIRFFGGAGDTKAALEAMGQLENSGDLAPDAIAYAAAITACRTRQHLEDARALLARAESCKLADVVVFNAMLKLLDTLGEADAALALLARMPSANAISYSHAQLACSRATDDRSQDALALLQRAREAKCANTRTYNAALSALEKNGRWREAMETFALMAPDGGADATPPDAASVRLVLFACVSANPPRLREALSIYIRAERGDFKPNVMPEDVSYRVFLRACDVEGGGALKALQMLCAEENGATADEPLAPVEEQEPFAIPCEANVVEDAQGEESAINGGDTLQSHFRVVYHESGQERMPRNHQDLDLFYCEDTASTVFKNIPAWTTVEAGVSRFDVPGVPGAFVLTNVLSRRECVSIVRTAEALRFRRDEPVRATAATAASTTPILETTTREDLGASTPIATGIDNVEWLCDPHMHERIFKRVAPHIPGATGINRRLRLFRYSQGGVYRPHLDGSWPACALDEKGKYIRDAFAGAQRSRLTFLIYLSDGCEGGHTTFYVPRRDASGRVVAIDRRHVKPHAGCVLCFPHGDDRKSALHEGGAVLSGQTKYVARTDCLFPSTLPSSL